MGILDRLSQMLRSNINDLISRAEDPEKMLNQILVDMRGQLVKAKQMVAAAIADEKRGLFESDGNNRGPELDEIQQSANGQVGQPWCAKFVWWSFERAALKLKGEWITRDRATSHGLALGPYASGSVVGRIPHSGVFVLPTNTNPARRNLAARYVSSSAT